MKKVDVFRKKHARTAAVILLGVTLFSAALVYYAGKIQPEITHPDETVRIRMSRYFKLFFIDRDFTSSQWQEWPVLGAPPVNAYITGTALLLGGQGDKIGKVDLDPWWDFKKSFEWNLSHITLPTKEELVVMKFTMALFVSFAGLILYWIASKCFGWVTAVVAFLFFVSHPLMLACATNITLDAPLVFFINANILLMLFFYQGLSKEKAYPALWFAAGIGLNTGLAAGTKIQGAVTGILFLVLCLALIFFQTMRLFKKNTLNDKESLLPGKSLRRILASGIIFGAVAWASFILPNPSLYAHPVAGIKKMIQMRATQMKHQAQEFSEKDYFHEEYGTAVLGSISQKVRFMRARIFERDTDFFLWGWFKQLLFWLGGFWMLYSEGRFLKKYRSCSVYTIVLIWGAVIFSSVTAVLYIDFATHYFTLVAPASLYMAYGVHKIAKKILGCCRMPAKQKIML